MSDEVITNHVVAAVISEHSGTSWPARPVCACGWVAKAPCYAQDLTVVFHVHVRAAER